MDFESEIKNIETNEETLDPIDWIGLKKLGVQMVENMIAYLEHIRDRPVWQPIPEDMKEFFDKPLPQEPEGPEETYKDFLKYVQPYPMGNIHPRFWGWVIGTGTPFGMLAEMLAAGLNPNVAGGKNTAIDVEKQVINWFKDIMGFPETASGLLVSGGSMANLVGLTVARNQKAGFNVRKLGVNSSPLPMAFYGSVEMHSSIQKAIELLGLGNNALRQIPVNENFQIDIDMLKTQISDDRNNGYLPLCIIGNAGTINTGAFDDLNSLAGICTKEDMWFHVDGAFGALAILSSKMKWIVSGMSKADSLAFDLHKWMYMPYEVGCVLVKKEEDHRRAFSLTPDYLEHTSRGPASGKTWFSDYGIQLSRGFRALKVWMGIKEHGIHKYGRIIQQNIDQAQYLVDLIKSTSKLELLALVPLNIVCFRYFSNGLTDSSLNDLNKELLLRLHESGVAIPSYTKIKGRYALRVAITNHRSKRKDFDILFKNVIKIGNQLLHSSKA
ncbi:MAG: pyridoxal phosphate-dependent decarboxylase family protein [Candidatus Hodarchaeales archaeon]|jgi:glutamate/tyrosine decarboxylase-like PLP-dependent enzyme